MITLTDMFCGCGGSSQGAKSVAGVKVALAINHWRLAVDSHNHNHPHTDHDCADISDTHPGRYGRTTGLIASPECTNHSLAKGQRRKNLHQGDFFQQAMIDPSTVRSRATMWDVVRFAEHHQYEFIVVENVVDVRYWVLFEAWLKAMHNLGYQHEAVFLNAQFAHGPDITGFAPQSRDRIYLVFWKKGNHKPDLAIRPLAPCPICGIRESYQSWKNGRTAGKYKTQYVYRCSTCYNEVLPFYYAALNALDFSIPMVKIGEREKYGKRPLSPITRARIQHGLNTFGLRPTILNQAQSSGLANQVRMAETDPLATQVARVSSYLFSPFLIDTAFQHAGTERARSVDDPLPTQTTKLAQGIVLAEPVLGVNRAHSTPRAFTDVLHTQVSSNQEYILSPAALYSNRGDRKLSALTDPISTQVAAGIQNWILANGPFLGDVTNKNPNLVTNPMRTEMTRPHHEYLETRQAVNLDDCYYRMLEYTETARSQGFPSDYIILGSKEQKQKQIGNANPPPTMELLVQRCVAALS